MKFKLFIFLILYSNNGFSQVFADWTNTLSPTIYPSASINDMKLDKNENVYICGNIFDTLTGEQIPIVTKYSNSSGNILWESYYNSPPFEDQIYSISVDDSSNAYVTGTSDVSLVNDSGMTIKYYANGQFAWIRKYHDKGIDNVIDTAGNVYSLYYNNAIAIVKYDNYGNTQWVSRNDTSVAGNALYLYGIEIDKVGNLYVYGRIDNPTSQCFVKKFNSNGVYQWQAFYNPSISIDYTTQVAVDDSLNVCLLAKVNSTGAGGIATVKYDAQGQQRWIRVYQQLQASSQSIQIDKNYNVLVNGSITDSNSLKSYVVIKYDYNGLQNWIFKYDTAIASSGFLKYSVIDLDTNNNIYMVCTTLSPSNPCDIATVMIDNSSGNMLWDIRYNNSYNLYDYAASVISNDEGSAIYISGTSTYLANPQCQRITAIRYLNSVGFGELNSGNHLSIYPNPSSGIFTVTLSGVEGQSEKKIKSIKIYDILGELVLFSEPNTNNPEFDLQSKSKGIYFISVDTQENTYNIKIIIQ